MIMRINYRLKYIIISFAVFLAVSMQYAYAGIFGSCNYYECILDKMPGTDNDVVANQIVFQCIQKCKDMGQKNKWRIGLSGKVTAEKCFVKHAKSTRSEQAAIVIRTACYMLYPYE